MKKPTNKELLNLLAENTININNRLSDIEDVLKYNQEVLSFLDELFTTAKPVKNEDEELIAFSKELYKLICEYCGKDGINFMGIA